MKRAVLVLALAGCLDFDGRFQQCADSGLCTPDGGDVGGVGGGSSGGSSGGSTGGGGGGTAGGAAAGGTGGGAAGGLAGGDAGGAAGGSAGGAAGGAAGGTVATALLRFAPASMTLYVPAGATPQQQVFNLFNDGSAAAAGLMVTGCSGMPFAMVSTCGLTLAGQGSPCTVTVTFSPQTESVDMCTITATETGGSMANATLIGNSTSLAVTPSPVSFADLELDAGTATLQVQIKNIGAVPLPPLTVAMASSVYSVPAPQNSCDGVGLGVDAGCTVDVTFKPVVEGNNPGTLNVTPNGQPTRQIPVTGVGYAAFDVVVLFAPDAGRGFAVGFDGGIRCPGDCREHIRRGTTVDVTAIPDAGYFFTAWDAGACSGQGASCVFNINGPSTLVPFFDRPGYVFAAGLTQGKFAPSCPTYATAAGLTGLTWTPFAWTTATPPAGRLVGYRGWVRIDGQPVVDTVADVDAGRFYYPIDLTASGTRLVTGGLIFIGDATSNCLNFTSDGGDQTIVGQLGGAGRDFHNDGQFFGCDNYGYFMCFETGHNVALPRPQIPVGGRRAFLSAPYPVEDKATADGRCLAEAGGTGSWVAMRSYSFPTLSSFVNTAGGTWYRIDGVKLYNQPSDLLSNTASVNIPLAPLNVLFDGGQLLDRVPVWTGTAGNFATAPNLFNSCNNWKADGGLGTTTTARLGDGLASHDFFVGPTASANCNGGTARLYCFEN